MLYDITRTLTPCTAVFPGDTPVTITPTAQMRAGGSCNVTAITMSAHAGTHVDAPRHYSDDGAGVEAVPLDVLIGPARVISLSMEGAITTADLQRALQRIVTSKCTSSGRRRTLSHAYLAAKTGTCHGAKREESMTPQFSVYLERRPATPRA